jgi:hypothetical protein
MNANAVARHYDRLTPEERFRLILAAGGRGDEAERDRLARAGGRLTLTFPEHAPYAQAFNELAFLVYIELLDEAARYLEAFDRADDCRDDFGEDETEPDSQGEGEDADATEKPAASGAGKRPVASRLFDLALAAGFVLKTKADGWKRFCERLNVPPWLLWLEHPGFDRLQGALSRAERAAFTPEGIVRWMNRIRPADAPERTEAPLTIEGQAADMERTFRKRAEWWGG